MLPGASPQLWLLPEGSDRERAPQYTPTGLKLLGNTAGDLPSRQLRSSNKQPGEELINKVARIYYLTGPSCFTNWEAAHKRVATWPEGLASFESSFTLLSRGSVKDSASGMGACFSVRDGGRTMRFQP